MNEAKWRRPMLWGAFCILTVAAIWFRTNHLTRLPFWLDEGYSAYGAEKGFDFIFGTLPGYETHPPFYTAIVRCWILLFGNSIMSFRALGVSASFLLLPFMWLCGREVARIRGGDLAVGGMTTLALAAASPSLVDWARVVRPYPLIALVFGIGIWAVLRIAAALRAGQGMPKAFWALYLLCQCLLFWLHNLGSLYVAALGLGLLILCGVKPFLGPQRWSFLLGHALVVLVALPAFLILLDQSGQWRESTWLRFKFSIVWDGVLAIYGVIGWGGVAMVAILSAFAFMADRRTSIAMLTMAAIPVLFALALSVAVAPVFLPRTLVSATVPFLVLLGLGATSRQPWGLGVLALLIIPGALWLVAIQKLPPYENWYGATAWLKARVKPGDMVYAYPNEGALPLHYALREMELDIPVRAIPEPVPSHDPTGWYPTGSRGVVSLPQYRLDQIAGDAQSQKVPTIWLLRLGAEAYDRGDGFLKALSKTRREVARFHQEPVFIIGLRQSTQPAPPQKAKP